MDIDLQKNTEKQFFFYLKGKPIDFSAAKNERLLAIARFFKNVLLVSILSVDKHFNEKK